MKPRSAKNKGRRLQKEVQQKLLERFKGTLEEDDIKVAIMGESGEDLKLSPAARKLIPYAIECKNQEKLNIWQALKQAKENSKEKHTPALIFRRNHEDTFIAIPFDKFLDLISNSSPLTSGS